LAEEEIDWARYHKLQETHKAETSKSLREVLNPASGFSRNAPGSNWWRWCIEQERVAKGESEAGHEEAWQNRAIGVESEVDDGVSNKAEEENSEEHNQNCQCDLGSWIMC
jgi:hypothetical protein